MKLFIDIVMKQIYLFNIVAWNYRKKIGFPVCKKKIFHRPSSVPEARKERSCQSYSASDIEWRFTAQPLSALPWLITMRDRNSNFPVRAPATKAMMPSRSRLWLTIHPLSVKYEDLATGRKRNLATGKRVERTKHDFRCPICRFAIGQAFVWFARAVVNWCFRFFFVRNILL